MTLRYFPSSLVESLIEAAKTGKKTRKPSIKQMMEPEKPGSSTKRFMTDEASTAVNKLEDEIVKKINSSFVADKPFDKLNVLNGEIAKLLKSEKTSDLTEKIQERDEILTNVKKTTELLAIALVNGLEKKVFDPEIDQDVSGKEDVILTAKSATLRRIQNLSTVYTDIIAKQNITQRSNNQIDNLLRSVSSTLSGKLGELQNVKDRTEIIETFWKTIIERINPAAIEPEVEEKDLPDEEQEEATPEKIKEPTKAPATTPTVKREEEAGGDYFDQLTKVVAQAKSDLIQVNWISQKKLGINFDRGVAAGVEKTYYISGQNITQVALTLRNSFSALEELFRGSEKEGKEAGVAVPSFSIDIEKNTVDNTISFTIRTKNQKALAQVIKAFFGTPAGANFGKNLTLTQDEAASFGEGTAIAYAQRREEITSDLTRDAYKKQLDKKIADMAKHIISLPEQIGDVASKISQIDVEITKRNEEIKERNAIIANPQIDKVEKKTAEKEIANLQKEQEIAQKTRAQYQEKVESLKTEYEKPLDTSEVGKKLSIDIAKLFAGVGGTVSSNVKQKLKTYLDSVESIIANKSKEQIPQTKNLAMNIRKKLEVIEMMKKSAEIFETALKIIGFAPANAVDVSLPPSVDFIVETGEEKYSETDAKSVAVFESNSFAIDDLNPVIDALRGALLAEDIPVQIPDPKDPKKTIIGSSRIVNGGIKVNISYSFAENKTSLTIKFNENSNKKISAALQTTGLSNFKQKFVMKKGNLGITKKISASAEYSTRELTRQDYVDLSSFVAEARPKSTEDYNKSIDDAEVLYQRRLSETETEIEQHQLKIKELEDQLVTARENNDDELTSNLSEMIELEKEEIDSKKVLVKDLNNTLSSIGSLSQKLRLIPNFAKQSEQLLFVDLPNVKILVNPNKIDYVIERTDAPYAPSNEATTRFTSNSEARDVEAGLELFISGLRRAVIREKEKDETAKDILGGVKITLSYSKPSFIVEISYDKQRENLLGRTIALMPESRDFLKMFSKKSGTLMITKQIATEPIKAAGVAATGEKLKAQKTPKGIIFSYGDSFTRKEDTLRRQIYITPNDNVEVTERDFDRFVESFTEGLETQKTDENLRKIFINARKLDKNNNFLFQVDINAFQSDVPLINRVKQASVSQEKFGFTISTETAAKPVPPVLEPGGLPTKPPTVSKVKKKAEPAAPVATTPAQPPEPKVAAPTVATAPEEPVSEPTLPTTQEEEVRSEIEELEIEKSGVNDQIKSVVTMTPKTDEDKESKDAALEDLESFRLELDKKIGNLKKKLEDIVSGEQVTTPAPAQPSPPEVERITPSVTPPTGKTFVPSEKETEQLRKLKAVQSDLKPIADLWRKVTQRGGGGAAVANLLQRASADLGDPDFARKLYKTAKELI